MQKLKESRENSLGMDLWQLKAVLLNLRLRIGIIQCLSTTALVSSLFWFDKACIVQLLV